MVKKKRHISDSDDHSGIESRDSAEMNKKDTLPDNKRSSVENVDRAYKVCHSSRI